MQLVIGLLIGILIGAVVLYFPLRSIVNRHRPIGDLRVDHSDPTDAPYLFLELDAGTDVNTIVRSKYATFRVKVKNFLPHE